ncbi:MAG: adenylate/guanylate cyclase domain-containing protein [Chthoniobacteraceae bacterium]
MLSNLRPTLRQVFAFSLLGLLLSLGLLFYLVFNGSEQTILKSSERLRNLASLQVASRVNDYLNEAPLAVAHFEKQVSYGLVDPGNAGSIQAELLSLLLGNTSISEASFTYAESTGFNSENEIQVRKSSIGEVTVSRSPDGQFLGRRTWHDGAQFVSESTVLHIPGSGSPPPTKRESPAMDPTTHNTFIYPSKKFAQDDLLWTDLHWSQLDDALPENKRRVELSVQKTIKNSRAQFAGVLRVGLMKEQIDAAVKLDIADLKEKDPYLIFICDDDGRLITGFGENSHIAEFNDDLRMLSPDLPPQVTEALRQPPLKNIDKLHPVAAASFRSGSDVYLCTFRRLPETQGWNVGIVVPRDYYLGPLQQIRRRILWASLALISGIILVGGFILHSVGRAHFLIVRETSRMNAFEFSPSSNSSRLGDVQVVLAGLEKAKTAMRAMSKYVPVNLVRKLYHEGAEPMLGGESVELSVLFTDIKEFTPFAERTTPDRLAGVLGRYLQIMATVIQGESGTIDKYIGDAVMAFWNAPETVAGHAVHACRAALECRIALRNLYDSPEWKDSPPFETRFGLHRCVASVGHFGAPDRFNYTAIGDGINFASRLEGLNKHYGTAIIASETIHSLAKEKFVFRLLDRVAVKGKTEGVTIYELISGRTAESQESPVFVRYEQAFAAFQRSDFHASLALLQSETQDPPSLALADRCRRFIQNPPPPGWDGVHIFDTK